MGRSKVQSETDWLECRDPQVLLRALRGRMTERKRRLFAVGCCQRIAHLIGDEASRLAIDVAGRYAEGLASRQELAKARRRALAALERARDKEWSAEAEAFFGMTVEYCSVQASYRAARAACSPTSDDVPIADLATGACLAAAAAGSAAHAAVALAFGYHNTDFDTPPEMAERSALAYEPGWQAHLAASRDESMAQCRLLRELVASPFRSVRMETSWLDWINGPIRRLVLAAYRERCFDCLPVVADMMEDAGCDSAPLLTHLRLPPTEHVLGCWAVDFLLRKE